METGAGSPWRVAPAVRSLAAGTVFVLVVAWASAIMIIGLHVLTSAWALGAKDMFDARVVFVFGALLVIAAGFLVRVTIKFTAMVGDRSSFAAGSAFGAGTALGVGVVQATAANFDGAIAFTIVTAFIVGAELGTGVGFMFLSGAKTKAGTMLVARATGVAGAAFVSGAVLAGSFVLLAATLWTVGVLLGSAATVFAGSLIRARFMHFAGGMLAAGTGVLLLTKTPLIAGPGLDYLLKDEYPIERVGAALVAAALFKAGASFVSKTTPKVWVVSGAVLAGTLLMITRPKFAAEAALLNRDSATVGTKWHFLFTLMFTFGALEYFSKLRDAVRLLFGFVLVSVPFFLEMDFFEITIYWLLAASLLAEALILRHNRFLVLCWKSKEVILLPAVSITFVITAFTSEEKVGLSWKQICAVGVGTFATMTTLMTTSVLKNASTAAELCQNTVQLDTCSQPVVLGATTGLALGGIVFVFSSAQMVGLEAVSVTAIAGALVVIVKVVEGPRLAQILLNILNLSRAAHQNTFTPSDVFLIVATATIGAVIGTCILAGAEGFEQRTDVVISVALIVAALVREGGIVNKKDVMVLIGIVEAMHQTGFGVGALSTIFGGTILARMLSVQRMKTVVIGGSVGIAVAFSWMLIGEYLMVTSDFSDVVFDIIFGLTIVGVAVIAGEVSGFIIGGLVVNELINSAHRKDIIVVLHNVFTAEISCEFLDLHKGSIGRYLFIAIPGLVGLITSVPGLTDTTYSFQPEVVLTIQILIVTLQGHKAVKFHGTEASSVLLSLGVPWVVNFKGAKSVVHKSLVTALVERIAVSGAMGIVPIYEMAGGGVRGTSSAVFNEVSLTAVTGIVLMFLLANSLGTSYHGVSQHHLPASVPSLRTLAAGTCESLHE